MQIDWWTLALQAVNFLVLVWLLQRFLYRPVRAVIEKRKRLAGEAFAEADAKKAEAEAARTALEDDKAKLAEERRGLLKKIHEEMAAERQGLLEQARREAAEIRKAAESAIAEQREAALADIREQAAGLAVELATRLLREAGPDEAGAAFLERLDRRLQDLPAEERERLRKDLDGEGARLTVVTAAPLSAEAQAAWRARLDGRLGSRERTDFAVEPAIVGGAELRFPHAVLKLTWADQLEQAREAMQGREAAS